jgi:ParB-like chromosome segregation protein Spo0J
MPKIEKHQDGVAPQGCFVPEMALTVRPIEALKRFGPETRKHPEKQIRALMKSLQTFGFNRPLIVDEDDARLGGDAVWEAARRLGLKEVPTIAVVHLTRAEKLAFKIADNRLAELRHAKTRRGPLDLWAKALVEKGKPIKLVAVALANKMARVAWALMIRGEGFRHTANAAA